MPNFEHSNLEIHLKQQRQKKQNCVSKRYRKTREKRQNNKRKRTKKKSAWDLVRIEIATKKKLDNQNSLVKIEIATKKKLHNQNSLSFSFSFSPYKNIMATFRAVNFFDTVQEKAKTNKKKKKTNKQTKKR